MVKCMHRSNLEKSNIWTMASKQDLPILCPHCASSFTSAKNMYPHIRKFHPTEEVNVSSNTLCGMCPMKLKNVKHLQEHFQTAHPDVALEFNTKTFKSKTDFEIWKNQHEKETMSYFVSSRGAKQLADNSIVKYYHCHRSGSSKVKETNRKRNLKRGRVNKIGATCPANMKVVEKVTHGVTEIEVQLQAKHVGHEMEVRRLPLPEEDKRNLAVQLSHGVPKSKVLTSLRGKYSSTKRISLISRKDLHNIARKFNISKGAMGDVKDAMSVNDILQEQHLDIKEELQTDAASEPNMAERKIALLNKVNNLIMTCDSAEKLKMLEETFAIAETNLEIMP